MTRHAIFAHRTLGLFAAAALVLAAPSCFNANQASTKDLSGKGRTVLTLTSMEWGRLVTVLDLNNLVVEIDALIRGNLQDDGVNYELGRNPVTEEETLTVLAISGSAAFDVLLSAAKAGLTKIDTKGPNNAPPYTYVPRNAAVRLNFSDLLDLSSVDATTVRIFSGNPPENGQEISARLIGRNGAKQGSVIIDPTVSALQASQLGLSQNSAGFPASFDKINDNLLIALPTRVNTSFGQPQVLRNQKRTRTFTFGPSDPIVSDLAGNPMVVRSMRTGGVADVYNGFLIDLVRPNLVTRKDVTLDSVIDNGGGSYDLTYAVNQTFCAALTPKAGDVFEIGAEVLVVGTVLANVPGAFVVRGGLVTGGALVAGGPGLGLSARMTSRYGPQDALRQACFVEFSPFTPPLPGNRIKLDPTATLTVRFDEPVDPVTVLSMHSFVLTAYDSGAVFGDPFAPFQPGTETVGDYVDRQKGYDIDATTPANSQFGGRVLFGPIEVGTGMRTFTLAPLAGITNPDAAQQYYSLALRDGPDGIKDLAGNAVDFTGFVAGAPSGVPPEQTLDVLPGASTDKYFSVSGAAADEDGDGHPEYGGQYDFNLGHLTGRPPQRFARQADSSVDSVSSGALMGQTTTPQAPFSPLDPQGSVIMSVYRPHDLGLAYSNPVDYNLDVEGLSWAPLGGVVNDDTYPRFSLAVGHAKFMPDEVVIPPAVCPAFPQSGLIFSGDFDDNILGFPQGFDESIVFDTAYTLRSINVFQASSGTSMLPYPSFATTYTYRDTAIDQTILGGAAASIGSPPLAHSVATGEGTLWGPEQVPSIGLPLLWRTRTYSRGNFIGANRFQTVHMVPNAFNGICGQPNEPAFRVLSVGGTDGANNFSPVIPDNKDFGGTSPIGGFLNGQPTTNHDPLMYWGQVDFVVRVSRVYTHWFDMGTVVDSPDAIVGTVLEPANVVQSPGTAVEVEFRGSASVSHPANPLVTPSPLLTTELTLDDYGDFIPGAGGSVSVPGAWNANPQAALQVVNPPFNRYFQMRITFVSNANDNLRSFIDGYGIAWKYP
ncbi:MAG TPA: hypothetical protein VGC54_08475 [Planctomycetota bacterium]